MNCGNVWFFIVCWIPSIAALLPIVKVFEHFVETSIPGNNQLAIRNIRDACARDCLHACVKNGVTGLISIDFLAVKGICYCQLIGRADVELDDFSRYSYNELHLSISNASVYGVRARTSGPDGILMKQQQPTKGIAFIIVPAGESPLHVGETSDKVACANLCVTDQRCNAIVVQHLRPEWITCFLYSDVFYQ